MKILKTNNSEKKVYSKTAVFLCSALGGPLVGGYMVSRNFKVFGDEDKAKKAIYYSIAFTLLLFCILSFVPNVEKIPKQVIPLFYASIYQGIVLRFQAKLIEDYKKTSGKLYGFFHNLIVTSIGLVIVCILGAAIYIITSKDSEASKSKTEIEWKTFDTTNYSIQYPANWQFQISDEPANCFYIFAPKNDNKNTISGANLRTENISARKLDFDSYINESIEKFKLDKSIKSIQENKKIESKNGYCQKLISILEVDKIDRLFVAYIFLKNNDAYTLNFFCEKEQEKGYIQTFDSIFNSFQLK